jgi:copper chaperone CopZ
MTRQTALVALFGLLLCSPFSTLSIHAAEPAIQVTTLQIPGMASSESEQQVEAALKGLDGVSAVKASATIESVVIVYDPVKTSAEEFIEKISDSGYLATFAKANFRCPKCTATYADAGDCIVDGTELEPIAAG